MNGLVRRGATLVRRGGRPVGAKPWPREESNLRARIRSPSLYPLSYGAVRRRVPASWRYESCAFPHSWSE